MLILCCDHGREYYINKDQLQLNWGVGNLIFRNHINRKLSVTKVVEEERAECKWSSIVEFIESIDKSKISRMRSQINSIIRHIQMKPWISQVCIFLLGFLVGCFFITHEFPPEMAGVQILTDNTLDFLTIDQYSPCLTQMVRKAIVPPSKLPYNLENGHREHSHGQAQLIKKLFKGMVGRK